MSSVARWLCSSLARNGALRCQSSRSVARTCLQPSPARSVSTSTSDTDLSATSNSPNNGNGVTGRPLKHVLTMNDFTKSQVEHIIKYGKELKKDQLHSTKRKYANVLSGRTLLMFFNKPSLRTRLSFEIGMTQMGGHAVYYHLEGQNLGVKESFYDTAQVVSRYADAVIARVKTRQEVRALAQYSSIPVINALDDYGHPCQILSDLMTIDERNKPFAGLKIAYLGDTQNNVTYDLMRGGSLMGMHVTVAGPISNCQYSVEEGVLELCNALNAVSGGSVTVTDDAVKAITGADVVYADSWMSYGISKDMKEQREKALAPYRITAQLMRLAKPDAIFLHCLPAMRGMEVNTEVIDGPQSAVFDQAENRLHAQKSLLLYLLGKI